MGMYTDLVCEAKIKEKYRERIHKIVFENTLESPIYWETLFPEEFAEDFTTDDRASMIPFGENNLKCEELFDGVIFRINCSIKNYTCTYEAFYEFLKEISDEIIEFKTHYEENWDWNEDKQMYEYAWKNWLTNEYEYVYAE